MALVCYVGAAASATAVAPKGRLVKDIQIQAFFHTAHPWQLKIYQPDGQDAEFGKRPVRVCFVPAPLDGRNLHTDCTALFGAASLSDGRMSPLQTLDSAKLEMLPGGAGRTGQAALVIRATFAGGGPGQLEGVYVWTDTSSDHQGSFTRTFSSVISQAGEQKFVTRGPLAGAFVAVDQVYEGDEANMESPVRYRMTIYEPVPLGYMKVLSMLSEKRYPSNHTGDGLPDPIATLTPIMSQALKAVYPEGVSVLQR